MEASAMPPELEGPRLLGRGGRLAGRLLALAAGRLLPPGVSRLPGCLLPPAARLAERLWRWPLMLAATLFVACGPAQALGWVDAVFYASVIGVLLGAVAVPLGLLSLHPGAPGVSGATGASGATEVPAAEGGDTA
jgi:hypothetical protein